MFDSMINDALGIDVEAEFALMESGNVAPPKAEKPTMIVPTDPSKPIRFA